MLDWLNSGDATPSKREVIHGDISPANVIVTPAGQAMLVDFGLLRVATQTSGTAEGTYMAPEVRSQGHYSPASDRYSFGGLAYFVLTGNHPPLDPNAIRAGLSQVGMVASQPGLLDQLMSIFSDDPSRRPSAGEWVRMIRQVSVTVVATASNVGLPPAAPGTTMPTLPGAPTPKKKSRKGLVLASVVLVALIAAAAAYFLTSGDKKTPVEAATDKKAATTTTVKATTTTRRATTTSTSTTDPDSTTDTDGSDTTSTDSGGSSGGSPNGNAVKLFAGSNWQQYVVVNSTRNSGPIAVEINGQNSLDGVTGQGPPGAGSAQEIDFNLSRKFTTFTGRVGVVDSSPAGCTADIQVIGDGKTLFDQTLALGTSQDVSVSVSGVLRVQVIFAASANQYNCLGALAEPTVS